MHVYQGKVLCTDNLKSCIPGRFYGYTNALYTLSCGNDVHYVVCLWCNLSYTRTAPGKVTPINKITYSVYIICILL
jgi:hypothetical protein